MTYKFFCNKKAQIIQGIRIKTFECATREEKIYKDDDQDNVKVSYEL